MSPAPPELSIVIVNFNTGTVLKKCLDSILQNTRNCSFEIFLVDNASSDGSVENVKRDFPQVKLISNSTNLYFTKANNIALRKAQGKYFMILNPDTYICDNAFKILIDFMDSHPESGACGPVLLNPDHTIQSIGHRFPNLTYALYELLFFNTLLPNNSVRQKKVYKELFSELDRTPVFEIDATSGSCMMVRREVSCEVGLLDEGLLMYFEETDWCRRIRNSGWKIYCVASSNVYHFRAKASEQVDRNKIERIFHESMCYYYKKHNGSAAYIFISILSLLNRRVLMLYRSIKNIWM